MEKQDFWSIWYNSDRPWSGSGDYETVSRIENLFDKICRKGYSIASAQCRDLEASVTFDTGSTDYPGLDRLITPCTTDGLECVNRQQELVDKSLMCPDYSIRFRCTYTGDKEEETGLFPQFDVRIYIILAVFPVLIFLIRILWAYLFRRRRQRRQQARRLARLARARAGRSGANDNDDDYDDDDDSSSIDSTLANPPPTYQQLFGESRSRASVFTICRGNVPVCSKCATTPCSVAVILKDSNNTNPLSGRGEETSVTPPLASQQQQQQQQRSVGEGASDVTSSASETSAQVNEADRSTGGVPTTSASTASESENNTVNRHWAVHSVSSVSTVDTFIPYSRNNSIHSVIIESETPSTMLTSSNNETALVPATSSEDIELQDRCSPVNGTHADSSTRQEPAVAASTPSTASSLPTPVSSPPPPSSPSSTILPPPPLTSSNVPLQQQPSSSSSSSPSTIPPPPPPPLPPAPSSPPAQMTPTQQPPTPLFSPLDSSNLVSNGISQPCACVCHRTIPSGDHGAGYTNAGFVRDEESDLASRLPGMHSHVPGLTRVWSQASVASVVTLSELPSYEDALELIKKKEAVLSGGSDGTEGGEEERAADEERDGGEGGSGEGERDGEDRERAEEEEEDSR